MKITNYIVSFILAALILVSCSDSFMDTDYTTYLDAETASELAASDPSALNAYMLGAFAYMVKYNVSGGDAHDDFSHMSVLHSTDLMGQDIALSAGHWFSYDYEHDDREFNYRRTIVNWLTYYTLVAKGNEIIDLFTEEPVSAEAKGVLAHGYALRGFAYYYLIQLYQHTITSSGDVNWNAPGVPLKYSVAEGISEEEQKDKNGNDQKDEKQKNKDKQDQKKNNNENKMSKENAEQMLNAAMQQEKSTQQRMKKAMQKPRTNKLDKEW